MKNGFFFFCLVSASFNTDGATSYKCLLISLDYENQNDTYFVLNDLNFLQHTGVLFLFVLFAAL